MIGKSILIHDLREGSSITSTRLTLKFSRAASGWWLAAISHLNQAYPACAHLVLQVQAFFGLR
jgi:hypothetical protein